MKERRLFHQKQQNGGANCLSKPHPADTRQLWSTFQQNTKALYCSCANTTIIRVYETKTNARSLLQKRHGRKTSTALGSLSDLLVPPTAIRPNWAIAPQQRLARLCCASQRIKTIYIFATADIKQRKNTHSRLAITRTNAYTVL